MADTRPSSTHRIATVPCPKCKGTGVGAPLALPCDLCAGGRAVGVDVGIQWTLEHGDTEPPPKEE